MKIMVVVQREGDLIYGLVTMISFRMCGWDMTVSDSRNGVNVVAHCIVEVGKEPRLWVYVLRKCLCRGGETWPCMERG
jgi:hypothetical protein